MQMPFPFQRLILLSAIENRLFKGNNRNIKVMSSGFQTKVGWNSNM
jgi:ubiquitin carboxyl-terminal hydrolase 25/28